MKGIYIRACTDTDAGFTCQSCFSDHAGGQGVCFNNAFPCPPKSRSSSQRNQQHKSRYRRRCNAAEAVVTGFFIAAAGYNPASHPWPWPPWPVPPPQPWPALPALPWRQPPPAARPPAKGAETPAQRPWQTAASAASVQIASGLGTAAAARTIRPGALAAAVAAAILDPRPHRVATAVSPW